MPRPLGSPNIRSKTVTELCKSLGFNPIAELIKLRNSTQKVIDKDGNVHEVGVTPELKAKICADLLPYMYPKLTAVQISGELQLDLHNLTDEELKEKERQLDKLLQG